MRTDAGTAEIHWPSGAKETVKLPAPDRIYTITEGMGITGALCAGKPCAAQRRMLLRSCEEVKAQARCPLAIHSTA